MSSNAHPDFKDVYEIQHPLIKDKLAMLREKSTNQKLFRELVHEITMMLGYEASRSLKLTKTKVQTPLESIEAETLANPSPVIFPILRAGMGMLNAMQDLIPQAKVGHVGLSRNEETFQPESYYFKVPPQSEKRDFFVIDPMLATGGSAVAAIDALKEKGAKSITFICIICAPEGIALFQKAHPDVTIYTASIDRKLDENCYIRPGLGDAGDRLCGTV